MPKANPAIIVVLGVPIGMVVGSEFGHFELGVVIGGCAGFVVGLAVLIWRRQRVDAS